MTKKSFFAAIGKIIDLLPEEEKIIATYLKKEKYLRGDFPVKENEISERVFFVVSGLIKEYYLLPETQLPGNEICTGFTAENGFYYCTRSFISGLPSQRCAVALEDTQTLYLSKRDLEDLYRKIPKTERLVRIITERHQVFREDREELRENKSYAQRYLRFLETHKNIANRIKIKDMASYLSMTPEKLSRIRREIM